MGYNTTKIAENTTVAPTYWRTVYLSRRIKEPAAMESGIANCGISNNKVPGRYIVARICIAAHRASKAPITKNGLIARVGIECGKEFPNKPNEEAGRM